MNTDHIAAIRNRPPPEKSPANDPMVRVQKWNPRPSVVAKYAKDHDINALLGHAPIRGKRHISKIVMRGAMLAKQMARTDRKQRQKERLRNWWLLTWKRMQDQKRFKETKTPCEPPEDSGAGS